MIFFEGMGDIVLPCAAAIVVPGLLVALAGGWLARGSATVFTVSVGVGLWMRAGGVVEAAPSPLLVGLGFVVAAGGFLVGRPSSAYGGALLAGAMAAWMWQPCVGVHLGEALTTASRHRSAALLPLVAYAIGLCWIVVGVAFAGRLEPIHRLLSGQGVKNFAVAGLGVLAVLAAGGWYEEMVALLLQWSVQG